jgi:uncharacterized protein YbjT (DUF2867 family)
MLFHKDNSSSIPNLKISGGNGYIGSHIVKQLLERGHHVKVVVRDPSNEEKVKHLKNEHWKTGNSNIEILYGEIDKADSYEKV